MNQENEKNRVTIADVARRAGVSTATVSYILSNRPDVKVAAETREKVLDACREMDYTPLASGREKTKRITIADIAAEAGVSTATVSYVLNNRQDLKIAAETRKKVLQVCNLHQYRPSRVAQSLAIGKNNMVGIAFNYVPGSVAHNQHALRLIEDLMLALRKDKYAAMLVPPDETHDGEIYVRENFDGIICIDLPVAQYERLKDNCFIPVVSIDMVVVDPLFFKTYNDFPAIVARAKKALGVETITFVTEAYRNAPYMAALEAALENDRLYVVEDTAALPAYVAAHKDEAPVFNGEILALAALDRVAPGKAAVVCDAPDTRLPGFHSICVPSAVKAATAITMLKNAIDRLESQPHTILIGPRD